MIKNSSMIASALPKEVIDEIKILRDENNFLKEQIEWFKRQLFGRQSEKIINLKNDSQLLIPDLDQEKPKVFEQPVASHTRKKPERNGQDKITLPEGIPLEKYIIDIPEIEKTCKETGKPLAKIGEEITRKLAYKRGTYYVKEFIRLKYAQPKGSEEGIKIAPLPDSFLERCQADESFLADILVKKFCDHLPLYRQAEILQREGISISRQTLCQWVLRSAKALKPLKDLMTKAILESGNVFIDETPISLLEPGKGQTHQAYMWVIAGGKCSNPYYRIYEFSKDRKHNNADRLLKGYRSILHSDKYGAYEALANQKQIIWCPCFAHIRRKFFDAESDPPFRDWVLRKIRYLFMFERIAWSRSENERLMIRQQKEVPIIDELIFEIKNKLQNGKILPKSKFREALGYFVGLIPHLKNYTLYPFARLDNNIAERAVRPLAIGRKNWLFVGSKEGGEAASIIFSLVQTCRAIHINPRDYLEDIMKRIMSHQANRLEELLPDEWAFKKGLLQLEKISS